MNVIRLRMKGYIQPFEQRLAIQELRTLSNAEPIQVSSTQGTGLEVELKSAVSKVTLADQLAFWECVETTGARLVTKQSLRESTVHTARNGVSLGRMGMYLPFKEDVPLPNRRCLRYGPHGIHEYRGKFFPQLVRSLINISGVDRNGLVADPMCGSGTTLVEAVLSGRRGVGLDMNPLSVLLARAKCRLLAADPSAVVSVYRKIDRALQGSHSKKTRLRYFSQLPSADQTYLKAWFSWNVLADLDQISQAIDDVSDSTMRDLLRISLSNILRRVSWQKLDDLRVRREIRDDSTIDAKKEFRSELERSVRSILAFLYQEGRFLGRDFQVCESDARECGGAWSRNSVDLVITSPPYATALPYLDTDRLSLCYLGLLPRVKHRFQDQRMIGNREVTESTRVAYWKRFEQSGHLLPQGVVRLIRRIQDLNARKEIGFRRRNLPALLGKYFMDMRQVLEGIHRVLKPGSYAFVVVGNNHTIAADERVEIETAKHLGDIARDVGFRVGESLKMEMLVSRDIFRRNATQSEEILALYKNVTC